MKILQNIFFYFILSVCLASCVHTSDVDAALDRAQRQIETHPDSAFVTLDSLDRSHLTTREQKARHALLYSIALENCGIAMTSDSIINIAVNYYTEAGDTENAEKALFWKERIIEGIGRISPADTMQIQNSRIILERYADKMELVSKRKSILGIILISVIVIALCLFIIRRYAARLRRKPDDKAMEVIRQRLAVLDKVLASHISSDDKTYRISEDEIETLMSDREEFLISTKVVFKESHPEFISALEKKGLSDWEIGYCCLYTLGLKGKDVGEFIRKKRHYIISSEIRKKLGLGEHDTNIGIWLRNLLSEVEKAEM